MMKRTATRPVIAAALFLSLSTATAFAGSPFNPPFAAPDGQTAAIAARNARLAAAGVLNVPDQNGCVKWCLEDLNPCDPPNFKQADGRCEEP